MRLPVWPVITWGRLVASLVIMLVCLQLIHMMLLSQLEAKTLSHNDSHESRLYQLFYNNMTSVIADTHIIDSSGEYFILKNLYPGGLYPWSEHSTDDKSGLDVTLASQTSPHLMHHILSLSRSWTGPVSIAVFTPPHQAEIVLYYILVLHKCLASFGRFVSIHLTFSVSAALPHFSKFDIGKLGDEYWCNKMETLYNKLAGEQGAETNYGSEQVQYPNNFLRNLALSAVKTSHVLVIDIDMLPSPALRSHFITFLQRGNLNSQNPNTLYVVPAFEIGKHCPLPANRTALLKLWSEQCVRPFYVEMCEKCQYPTDYKQWQGLLTLGSFLSVAYDVEWKDPWEPFFIAPHFIPRYDERFKQYGFNRISQVCELHIAGFRFSILDSAFLLHQGFKRPRGFHKTKNQEQEHNRILFRNFKQSLKTKYPNTKRRCY